VKLVVPAEGHGLTSALVVEGGIAILQARATILSRHTSVTISDGGPVRLDAGDVLTWDWDTHLRLLNQLEIE
jgi:hypothetical protein